MKLKLLKSWGGYRKGHVFDVRPGAFIYGKNRCECGHRDVLDSYDKEMLEAII